MLEHKFGYLYVSFDKCRSSEFIGKNARLKAIKMQLEEDGATNLKAKRCTSYFNREGDHFIYFDFENVTYRILLSLLFKLLDGKHSSSADKIHDWSKYGRVFL